MNSPRKAEAGPLPFEKWIRLRMGVWIFAMMIVICVGAYAGHHADNLEETARIFFFGISLMILLVWLAVHHVSHTFFILFDTASAPAKEAMLQFTETDKKESMHREKWLRRQVKQGSIALVIIFCVGIFASYLTDNLEEMITLFYYWDILLIFTLCISITQVFRTLSAMLAILQKRLDRMG